MDSYLFTQGLDSIFGDVAKINLTEETNISQELFNLPCFNTLGYFKNTVNKLTPSKYFRPTDGIYIKNIIKNFPIKVVNLDRRPDRWESVSKKLNDCGITHMERFSAIDGSKLELTPEIRTLFRNNDFNFRQGVVGCALSHIKLWKDLVESNNDYTIILEDDIELDKDFDKKLNVVLHQINQNTTTELVFLGYHLWKGSPSFSEEYPFLNKIDVKDYMGGTFGYIVSKAGAWKLLQISKFYGIQNGIDRFMHINFDKMNTYFTNFHLILSDVCWGNSIDSDIQKNHNPVGINKKFISIKLLSNSKTSKELVELYSKYTKNNTGVWNSIKLTDSNDADYFVILNNCGSNEYYEPDKTLIFQTENVFEISNKYKSNLDKFYKVLSHSNHHNLPKFEKSYDELSKTEQDKSKILCVVETDKNKEFLHFFKSKTQHMIIDKDGISNLNLDILDSTLDSNLYKYNIIIEDYNFTDKLYNGIINESLCFYSGCSNTEEYIDSRTFIRINLDNFEQAYDTIVNAIDSNEWEKRISFIRESKTKILNELQIMPCIERLINEKEYYVTPLINSGLGNQMFMIANAYAVSKDNNMKFIVNDKYNDSRKPYWDTLLKNLTTKKLTFSNTHIFKESSFSYNKISIPKNRNILLYGYYQSEKYFEKYKDEITELFKLPQDIDDIVTEKINNLPISKTKVMVHIRRGDYVGSNVHAILDKNYYEKAKEIIESKHKNVSYLYFTDDKQWVRENFLLGEYDVIVNENEDYIEFGMMTKCDHFIIANSSFSWWAAYLSKTSENKTVITPSEKLWFLEKGPNPKDLIKEDWIKID